MHSVIWIPPSNRIDSSWLSAADCIWEGPQWLESKQCLKLEIYRELEPLFKLSLRIPDASQIDVFNDLLMLKSYGGDKIAFRSQATTHTQPNIGTTRAQYQVTSDPFNPTDKFQSITSMEAYQKHSFEVKVYCRSQRNITNCILKGAPSRGLWCGEETIEHQDLST